MASSSEPESQHVYASTPLILTRAVKPCLFIGVLPPSLDLAGRTFGLLAQCWLDAAFNCFLVLPCGRGCKPLPRNSKASFTDLTRSSATAASSVVCLVYRAPARPGLNFRRGK